MIEEPKQMDFSDRCWRGTTGLARMKRLEKLSRIFSDMSLPRRAKEVYIKLKLDDYYITYNKFVKYLVELQEYDGIKLATKDGKYIIEEAKRIDIPYILGD